MPIKIQVNTSAPCFPDAGSAQEYLDAVSPVISQVVAAIKEFATHRVDRTTVLKDATGHECGSIEILRY